MSKTNSTQKPREVSYPNMAKNLKESKFLKSLKCAAIGSDSI